MKVFVSHAHDDAKALSEIKKYFSAYGIEFFLAHEDIAIGEHDLDRIKKEIKKCDIFLIIGNELSKNSFFCNQEIGFALGLERTIISTIDKKTTPWGFIGRQQSIKYDSIDNSLFFFELFDEILNRAPHNSEHCRKKQYLKKLGVSGFCVNENIPNKLTLKSDNWNDHGYCTRFEIKGKFKSYIRIGFKGQQAGQKTVEHLPKCFPFLGSRFFSRINYEYNDSNISEDEKEALSFLLNDVSTNLTLAKKNIDEEVLDISLYRDDEEALSELRDKCNSSSIK